MRSCLSLPLCLIQGIRIAAVRQLFPVSCAPAEGICCDLIVSHHSSVWQPAQMNVMLRMQCPLTHLITPQAVPDMTDGECSLEYLVSVVLYDHVQVADNLPLYGVCCYMDEMVHRPPSLLKAKYPDCNMPLTRYLVAAPRCYCFLTHYPFFSLHMKVAICCLMQQLTAPV